MIMPRPQTKKDLIIAAQNNYDKLLEDIIKREERNN